MKNILCAIDFSDNSDVVIQQAKQIAKAFSAKLWILHVAAPEPDFVGFAVGPQNERDWRAMVLKKEHRIIQKYALQVEEEGIVVSPLLVEGQTVETILRKIDKFEIDLLVIGTHGHGALYSMVIGSTSKALANKSPIPTLLVPAPKP